jgi:hypothetical protein
LARQHSTRTQRIPQHRQRPRLRFASSQTQTNPIFSSPDHHARTHTHTHKHPLLSRHRARLIVQNSVHRHQLVDRTLHQSQEQSKERLSGHPPAVDRLTVSLDISTLRRHNPTHSKPFHLPSNDIYTTFLRTVQH